MLKEVIEKYPGNLKLEGSRLEPKKEEEERRVLRNKVKTMRVKPSPPESVTREESTKILKSHTSDKLPDLT